MRHGLLLLALSAASAFGQYTYYYTDSFSTIDTTKWWVNTVGSSSLSGSATGLYGNGSLISKIAVPDGSSDYEVKATFVPAYSSYGHVIYLRASNNTASICAGTATFYALWMYDNSGGLGMVLKKSVAGAYTQLFTANAIPLTSPITVRASIRSDGPSAGITIRVGSQSWFINDTSITSGQPGIGVNTCNSTPYSNYPLSRVEIGPIDRVGPNQVSSAVVTGSFPDKTILSWSATTDDANGVGVQRYHILRDGVWLTSTTSTMYTDETSAPATTYTYTIVAEDWHGSIGTPRNLTVTTPSYLNWDPRRTGITPTGSYWGAMGEQIDTQSANLNFTLPLMKVRGRGSWSTGINLTYNSQLWRYLSSPTPGTIKHGADVGYGFGWRLLAGAIFPFYSGATFSHYVFLDSTGGEHKLNFNEGGVWRGTSGLQVRYDENLSRLYFNDGSFWQMDCISAGTEQDAGTRYPTLMQDSNGNQVIFKYMPSIGSSTINTSARIKEIQDVRAVYGYWSGSYGYRTFQFTYNTDAIPHLTKIENTISTSEKYDFTYSTPVTLTSPFDGSTIPGAAVPMLSTAIVTGLSIGHTFEYANTSGEMTKVIFPYNGELRYEYITFTFAAGHKLREVGNRYLVKQSGATPKQYRLERNPADSALAVHTSMSLYDPDGIGMRSWTFIWDGTWRSGLQHKYLLRVQAGSVTKSQEELTWALAPSGFPYVGVTVSTTDVGTANEKVSKTEQTLDGYGNLLQKKEYNYGNLTTPARTTNCTYVTTAAYINRNIRNLLNSCTLTAGTENYTLVANTYDSSMDSQAITGLTLHDSANYQPTMVYRGNLSASAQLGNHYVTTKYNMVGAPVYQTRDNLPQTVGYNGAYSAPAQITTNGNSQIQTNLGYTSFLGLSNAAQANGTSVSFTYDSYARPATQSTPDGNITFTYATAAPWWKQATIAGKWTKTWFDGFGRTIKEESGDAGGTKSIVETEYDSCACSPIGKLKRVSRPYAPSATVYWTTYTYDALGRTTSVAQPNSSGTTTYSYAGNTVTVTDPAARWKKFTSDALGNLVQVNEPNPAGGVDYVTSYTYNALNKLTQVSMPRPTGTQTRTFVYNTQGQLTSETHPESGTTTYTYGAGSALVSKIDAKNHKTQWNYDGYRRIYQEQHFNSVWNGTAYVFQEALCEQVNYRYDGYSVASPHTAQTAWGRLAETSWGDPTTTVCGGGRFTEQYGYAWNGLTSGKTIRVKRVNTALSWLGFEGPFEGDASLTAYWSWSFGQLASVAYPSWYAPTGWNPPAGGGASQIHAQGGAFGRRVTTALDSMKRLSSLSQQQPDASWTTIVDNVNYGSAGELTQIRYNGVNETRSYDNSTGQLTGISYNNVLRYEYRYSTTANDGRLLSYKNWQSGEDIQYQYDSLARLTSAQTAGPEWGQSYSYDGFGNLTAKTVTKGTATALSVGIDPLTNQMTGVTGLSYDANGNMANIPGIGAISYDGRNRQVGVGLQWNDPPKQGYDPSNRKIWRNVGDFAGNIDVDFYLPSGEKIGTYRTFLHSLFDAPLNSSEDTCNFPYNNQRYCIAFQRVTENLYFAGRLIKTEGKPYQPTFVEWVNQDRLSSAVAHLPYGEERTVSAQDRMKFATYYRESTGLDYAMNRYYSSVYGRFTTPDPYRASGGPADPGSWNRYTYVGGDPVNRYDPTGLWWDEVKFEAPDMDLFHLMSSGGGGGGWGLGGGVSLSAMFLVPFGYPFDGDPGGGGGGSPPKSKQVTRIVITEDCWMDKNPKTGAPSRNTKFVAYDGDTSLEGDPDIVIQEKIAHANGDLATDVIGAPDSKGSGGVFNDQKGLSFKDLGPINVYQSFTVSIAGGAFTGVPVSYSNPQSTTSYGTLGVYFTWNYPNGILNSKDYNVFVTGGGGKDGLAPCK